MKVLRGIATGGIVVLISLTLIGCGSTFNYTGEATVVSKGLEHKKKKKSSTSKSKNTNYEITLDLPNTDIHQVIGVPKNRYDAIQPQQKVQIVNGKLQ